MARREDATQRMKELGGRQPKDSRELLVPSHLAKLIPDDTVFKAELHPDGLLYRVVQQGTERKVAELPRWLK